MRFRFFLIVSLLIYVPAVSQQLSSDKQTNQVSVDDTLAMNTYSRIMNHNYDIVNGPEYIVFHKLYHTNPFFQSATICSGTVFYNGHIYSDYKLIYDIFKDEIVVNYLTPSGYLKLISLNKHFVDSFDISVNNITSRFQKILFKPEDEMKDGYYEIKFRGKAILLLRYIKTMSQVDGQDEYFDALKKYILLNGEYHTITTLRKFIKLFGENKNEMKKYIRSLRVVSFRKISDIELIQIFAYYDSLK